MSKPVSPIVKPYPAPPRRLDHCKILYLKGNFDGSTAETKALMTHLQRPSLQSMYRGRF